MDIGSSQMAQLDALAFEGATKRSKPNLKVRRASFLCDLHTTLISDGDDLASKGKADDRSEH